MYILKFTFSDIDVTVSTWHPNMKFGAFKLLMAKLDATCPAWLRQRPEQTQKTPRSSAAQHRHPKKNATTWGYLCAEQHYWVRSVPFSLAKESLGTQGLTPQRRNMFTTACLQYAIQACHTINSSQYMYLYIHTYITLQHIPMDCNRSDGLRIVPSQIKSLNRIIKQLDAFQEFQVP